MTMNWHIPPVGWCAVCLATRKERNPAEVMWRGTSLCEGHLRAAVRVASGDTTGLEVSET